MTQTTEDYKHLKGAGAAVATIPAAPAFAAPVLPPEPWALPIPQATAVSGLSRSAIYREAGRGNIVLLKSGRTTLVDMATVRAFLASLPRAVIRAPRTRPVEAA